VPAIRIAWPLIESGLIFFTTQDSNFVGRLDPRTGKIEFGSNKIGKINPKTLNEKRSNLLSASFQNKMI
jgi:hypothetical protein